VEAEAYIRMIAWSGPIAGAMFAVNSALRGAGDTKTPFFGMLMVNLVNMGTSILFVFGPEPIGGMGVKGIASGTVVGWAAGLLMVVVMLALKKRNGLRWSREGLVFHRETMVRIGRIGIPQAIEIGGMWCIHSYGIRVISNLSSEGALGAHFIAIRLESMSFLPGFAVAAAAATLTGQYLGAGSAEMAVRAVRYCWKVTVCIMAFMGLCFVVFREDLIGLMAPGSLIHSDLASPLLVVCALAQPFFATCIIMKTSMRGAGASRLVMQWAFGSMLFYRVGFLWVLTMTPWLSLTMVWVVLSLDLMTQGFVFSRLHFQGKWLRAKV
jgi:putative MATE family efflux protein